MQGNLEVALDVGSDKVKVAFAYKESNKAVYGKLAPREVTGSAVVSAIAYYDEDNGRWLFGDEAYKGTDRPFITVVKIKTLLSLLLKRSDKAVCDSNRVCYREGRDFPKFYFPTKRKISENLMLAKDLDMTFCADRTPMQVCEEFFDYLFSKTVLPAIERLQAQRNLAFDSVDYSLIYPAKAGAEYIEELTRLVERSVGSNVKKVMSSTRALGLFAFHRGILDGGEGVIIVDMGEEDISVAKLSLSGGKVKSVLVDGVDGHNEPMEIGGNDFDIALRDYIEDSIGARETPGAPPSGEDGYIAERGLHSKQFLFMTEIKKVKTALSLPDATYDNVFPDGAPISLYRDVTVQRMLTRDDFCKAVGIDGDCGVAAKIADYIIEELNRSINKDVDKLLLSGGVTETYGLIGYLRSKLRKAGLNVDVVTFDDYENRDDGFRILSYEDSLFAPAVGGAIVALNNYEIKTAVALSYGTWQYRKRGDKYYKILDIFLKRGQILPPDGGTYYTESSLKYMDRWSGSVDNEEIFSTTESSGVYVIGEPDSEQRVKMQTKIGLRVVSGGKSKGKILFYYCKEGKKSPIPVQIKGVLYFLEGVKIDGDGRAQPFIRNNVSKNGAYDTIAVRKADDPTNVKFARYKDIVLQFQGVEEFDVEGAD